MADSLSLINIITTRRVRRMRFVKYRLWYGPLVTRWLARFERDIDLPAYVRRIINDRRQTDQHLVAGECPAPARNVWPINWEWCCEWRTGSVEAKTRDYLSASRRVNQSTDEFLVNPFMLSLELFANASHLMWVGKWRWKGGSQKWRIIKGLFWF